MKIRLKEISIKDKDAQIEIEEQMKNTKEEARKSKVKASLKQ